MYLMGLDIGTSSAKCLLIDRAGRVAARAGGDYPLYTPRPGWAEQEPEDWVSAAFAAVREMLAASGVAPGEIAGVALSGQMHGLVPLDGDGRVLRRAILWCDQRTQAQCDAIEAAAGGREALLERTNNVMLTGYTGGKLLWLREREPEHFARMKVFLCPKDYLRYRLTGALGMDVSEASGTGLFDTRARDWCWEVIDAVPLPRAIFPPTAEATAQAGTVTQEAAEATGLRAGTPVFYGGGDAVVQAFGSGLIREGLIGAVIGTAGNVSMGFTRYTRNPGGKLQAFCGVTPGSYMSFGATQAAGGALRWFRDEACRDLAAEAKRQGRNAFDLMSEEAAQSPPGAGGVAFAPYLSGERCPYPDANARGVLYGMSLNTTRADMIRAVMEGIVFSLGQIVEIYRGICVPESVTASGGGASSPLFLRLQADIFNLPVRTVSAASEGGAYGAALLAGLGLGWYRDAAEAVSVLREERRVEPDAASAALYQRPRALYDRIYPALRDVFAFGAR